jgi:hypothetical protein
MISDNKYDVFLTDPKLNGIKKIQNAWRSYTNRKVYRYYRDIVLLKSQTKPSHLLKAVNPLEAQLLENGTNLHIRFRLGGERFPPTIYYKIYAHTGVCDIGSFAPRDYSKMTKEEREQKKMYYKDYKEQKAYHDGWYIRQENNGWRPLHVKPQEKKDFVEITSANKVKYFHHDKDLRKKKNEKQKRLNKLRWFQTMFEKARQEEPLLQGQPNPFESTKLIDMEDDDFKKEVDDLIEWSDNLDFDSYTNHWKQLSTADTTGQAFSYTGINGGVSVVETEFEEVN